MPKSSQDKLTRLEIAEMVAWWAVIAAFFVWFISTSVQK